jgi:hypothetical protein
VFRLKAKDLEMRREASRVSFLMCPFYVRALMPGMTTRLMFRAVITLTAGAFLDVDETLVTPAG